MNACFVPTDRARVFALANALPNSTPHTFCHALASLDTPEEMHAYAIGFGLQQGFNIFGMAIIDKLDLNAPVKMLGHGDEEWLKEYQASYIKIDPSIAHSSIYTTPYIMDVRNNFARANRESSIMSSGMQKYERSQYLTFPIHGGNRYLSCIRYGNDDKSALDSASLAISIPILFTFATYLHEAAIRIIMGKEKKPEGEVKFSDKEKDILRWLAAGLSIDDIAGRLFISNNTVLFHLKNIHKKLDVKTRCHAIAKAIYTKVI